MKCDEAAEYVSALCDGEVVPRDAAEHMCSCPTCQERLREYSEMGMELRLMASTTEHVVVAPRVWRRPENPLSTLWQKGWGMMRIPRFAFAALWAVIAVLSLTLAVGKVRAHDDGTVVLLKIAWPKGSPVECPLSTLDKNDAGCGGMAEFNGQGVGYQIDLIGRKGNTVELEVRTQIYDLKSFNHSTGELQSLPAKQVILEPGQEFALDFDGAGAVAVSSEWIDHVPTSIGGSKAKIDPGPNELRVTSPLLLSNKQVIGDMDGGTAWVDKSSEGVVIYFPGHGRFILSIAPLKSAIQARVALNRISFEDEGHSYVLVTGSPVTRGKQVWVLHEQAFLPTVPNLENGYISAGELSKIAPEALIPALTAKN